MIKFEIKTRKIRNWWTVPWKHRKGEPLIQLWLNFKSKLKKAQKLGFHASYVGRSEPLRKGFCLICNRWMISKRGRQKQETIYSLKRGGRRKIYLKSYASSIWYICVVYLLSVGRFESCLCVIEKEFHA